MTETRIRRGHQSSRQASYTITAWMREGYTIREISDATGISRARLSIIMNDPPPQVTNATHNVLALLEAEDLERVSPYSDATGSRRRIHHLQLRGIAQAEIAAAVGCSRAWASKIANGHARRIDRHLAARIRAHFEENRTRQGTEDHARNHAMRKGWLPITAFTDPDDPDDTPREAIAA